METSNFPDRIYLPRDAEYPQSPDIWWEREPDESNVEYIRTDVFIEKACEFLSKSSNYNEGFIYPSHSGVIDAFVNNFKNYIKGE